MSQKVYEKVKMLSTYFAHHLRSNVMLFFSRKQTAIKYFFVFEVVALIGHICLSDFNITKIENPKIRPE